MKNKPCMLSYSHSTTVVENLINQLDPQQLIRSMDRFSARAGCILGEGTAAVVTVGAVCVDVTRAEPLHALVRSASRKRPAWIAMAEYSAATGILFYVHRPARRPSTVTASLPAELHVAEHWGWL